ncbi:hypothetical protein GW796_06210 [archaeon]|nr:hypothetical protein [archaeon]
MFDKADIKNEHIEEDYNLLQEYCKENKLDLLKFISNKENINQASIHIHKKLNFAIRLIIKPIKIESLLNENHDWIIKTTKEYIKQEKKKIKK